MQCVTFFNWTAELFIWVYQLILIFYAFANSQMLGLSENGSEGWGQLRTPGDCSFLSAHTYTHILLQNKLKKSQQSFKKRLTNSAIATKASVVSYRIKKKVHWCRKKRNLASNEELIIWSMKQQKGILTLSVNERRITIYKTRLCVCVCLSFCSCYSWPVPLYPPPQPAKSDAGWNK